MEPCNLVSSLEYLVSNGRQVLLGGIRLGVSATRREATEERKATKMPKIGTVIRCSKCQMPGHNRSTCEKRSRVGTSQEGGSSKPAGNTHAAVNSEGVGNSQPAGSHSGT